MVERESRRVRDRYVKLNEISRRVAAGIWDLDTVFQEVVDGARTLTNARYGAVGVCPSPNPPKEGVGSVS